MGIIGGKELDSEPSRAPVRIVVKLAREARLPPGTAPSTRAAEAIAELLPEARFEPFTKEADSLQPRSRAVLNRYVAVVAPDRARAEETAQRLNSLPEVEIAYVEGGPTPPPVNLGDDPRSASQGYLGAAHDGVDVRWAWNMVDGTGIGFVDMERGWTLDHEDLTAADITIISGVSQDFHGHGTAVLGKVVAIDNMRGGVGIAPGADARVVS